MKPYAYIMLAQLFLIPSLFAQDQAGLGSDQNLLASCKAYDSDPEQISARQCMYYIKGFLAGAWGTDDVTMAEIKKKTPETFAERAYRTRLGSESDRLRVQTATYFCSPIDEPEARIIDMLSKESFESIETVEGINSKIHQAIKTICPSSDELKK